MSQKTMKLNKGDYLFREGDTAGSMFLVKSGRMAITKANGADGEVVLAEKINGELLGEMGFFETKPRSAAAKALVNSELIELPFGALQEQYQQFPPWLKVMMKTVVGQLRDANTKIRNLENIAGDSKDKMAPHTLLRICAMATLLADKSQENTEEGPAFPYKELVFYCNSIFHIPGGKINKAVKVMQNLQLMNVEEMDGTQYVIVCDVDTLREFVVWYNGFLSAGASEEPPVEERELPVILILSHYGSEEEADDKGIVHVNLTEAQKRSNKDVGQTLTMNDFDNLTKKGLLPEKTITDDGMISKFNFEKISCLARFWTIIHAFAKNLPSD